MAKKKKQYYVIINGHQPGIYTKWFGQGGAAEQIEGFPDAIYRGFHTHEEAMAWLGRFSQDTVASLAPDLLQLLDSSELAPQPKSPEEMLAAGKVLIYTDGGAVDNPGPGGYGVVLRYKRRRRELSGGFRCTTNNRMELLACIEGLRALKQQCTVVLFSDSSYVVNAMTQGWVERWQSHNWRLSTGHKVKNSDLWQQLIDLSSAHDVEFRWVRGHSGNPDNERCDQMAMSAARGRDLPADEGYEALSH